MLKTILYKKYTQQAHMQYIDIEIKKKNIHEQKTFL